MSFSSPLRTRIPKFSSIPSLLDLLARCPTLPPVLVSMCYYHQIRWECGYWRWGRFREQCNREYRIGETCGLMLVYETEEQPTICAVCCQLQKKLRRYDKMWQDVRRWHHEGGKPATVERTCEEMHVILKQIQGLRKDHDARCRPLFLGCFRRRDSRIFTGYIEEEEKKPTYQ
uniref:Uncharacterized protein n=1 Tax=Bionectria ochroleuca TaxID=29856 RepID=A0A0B7KRY0_BIOOC